MEIDILNWIQENMKSEAMDWLMPKISLLGSLGFIWILVALLLVVKEKHRGCGLTIGAGLIANLVVCNVILKPLVARPRPCWGDVGYALIVDMPSDYSFPSGHTMAGFVVATILFTYNKGWGIAAYLLASLIAFSRLYLYVHYPTDVLAGIALGIAIGLLIAVMAKKNSYI